MAKTTPSPRLALGVTLLAATAMLSAQQPQATTSQTPRFRSATDVISTDVIVRDNNGLAVPDLTIKDFEVYEDGVLQKITNFAAIVGGRAMTEVQPQPEAPIREGLVLPKTSKVPSAPGRIFIIFIDDLHIQPLDSNMAKQVLKQIRDNLIHEGDLVGLVSSGFSSISFDLSPDPRRVRFDQAIDKFMGAGKTPLELINAAQTLDGPSGLRADAYTAFKTAYEILDQAEKVTNRRKAFIYVSSGYDFNPFKDSRWAKQQELYERPATPMVEGRPTPRGEDPLSGLADTAGFADRNPFDMNGLQFSNADLAAALGELTRRARRANVTFYPVDPRGLIAGQDISLQLGIEEWTSFVNTSLSSLDVIAGETGGFCVCRTNDFKSSIQRIDNDMSDYYMIGYESNNPDPMKVTRRIEIKVKREGIQPPIYKSSYSIKR